MIRFKAEPISVVKALYDYEAQQGGEISVSEDEVLHVYGKDEDWLLVQSQKEGGKIGYVPGNYVEEVCLDMFFILLRAIFILSNVHRQREKRDQPARHLHHRWTSRSWSSQIQYAPARV